MLKCVLIYSRFLIAVIAIYIPCLKSSFIRMGVVSTAHVSRNNEANRLQCTVGNNVKTEGIPTQVMLLKLLRKAP